jgi:hypothetical protein
MRNPSNHDSITKLDARACALAIIFLVLLAAIGIGPLRATHAQTAERAAEPAAEAGAIRLGQDIDEASSVAPNKNSSISPDAVTATSYPFSNQAGVALEDMSAGTTQVIAPDQDDTASTVQNIGFDFWFDGVRNTQFSVNANGLMRLGGTVVSTSFINDSTLTGFTTTTNNPKLAPYYDDLWVGTNGKVHFKVVGSAPNRKLVVEWLNEQIPRNAGGVSGLPGAGTFQAWIFETTGVVEFVYGNGIAVNSANAGYTVGIATGSATATFASVTTSTSTVSYATANSTQTNAIAAGTAYLFTPPVPADPTNLTFTGTQTQQTTLNWIDNSSNEVGFVIYRSDDGGTTYNFITQTAANATSSVQTGLNPNTTYFWRVRAVTEGALNANATSAQASITTAVPGSISSTAAGGLWSSTATWTGGVIPTVNDNVTILDGATVTIDTAAIALNVQVGQGASGILQFEDTTARTLTLGQGLTISANGTFQTAATGTQTGHVLSVATDLVNNGTLDFSTNANTAGAGITFTGAANNSFSGTGPTTDIRTLTINKGTSSANTLELLTSNFTVQGATTDSATAAYLTLTNGTFKISGTFTANFRTFTAAAYTIPATAGFWLNNPNYTVTGQNGSPTNNGLLKVGAGTLSVGTASGNSMGGGAGAVFQVDGGTINVTGRLTSANAVTYTQTGGTVNVSTIGNAATTPSFGFTSTTSTFNMSGGAINLVQANTNATPLDYQVSSTANITGGTLNVGTAATATAFTFRIRGQVPALVIDNTTNNKNVLLSAQTNTFGDVTIKTGTSLNTQANIWLVIGTTITNNGTITVPTSGARFYFLGTGPQVYTGTGTATIVTATGSVDLTMDNPAGLTIDPASGGIITQRVNFFRGSITNSNKLTLGNGGVTVGVIQYGLTGGTNIAGNFDQSPVFNIGTGGQTVLYAQEPAARTTSFEIPPSRSIFNSTINNTNGVILGGGDLTITGTLTFTAGNITTNANTIIIGTAGTISRTSGHVIGNLRKTYTAAGSKTYEVGTANGFSPVTVNATAGTFPADFTAKATQGPQPAVNPATSIQRYWTLNATGITADLTFQYLAADVLGTEANYRVIRVIGGTSVSFPTSTVNTGTHVATLTGVSVFSDWTVGETSAPTAAPAIISGQVTSPDGTPLGGVIVSLGGSQSARTITDGNGRYRFDSIETGKLYVVRPDRANYTFSPSERTFSLNADKTDAVFTANPASIPTGNPVDTDMYFVRQQYLDFLGREPDNQGLLYWTSELDKCGTDADCLSQRRIGIAAAFFMEEEHQQTGSFVYRLYKGALGRQLSYDEFSADRQKVVGGDDLESSKVAFADTFVARPEFKEKYSQATGAESFVDSLLASMQQTSGADLSNERNALIESYNGGKSMNHSRALALRKAIDVAAFKDAEYNKSFVLMEYFGYLKRNPEPEGFQFWLNVLDNKEPGNYRGMVCSFITSAEYQLRFSPVVPHSNRECR